jgi:glycine dehydrogenase subunit 1
VNQVNKVLLDDFGVIGGYDLGRDYPTLEDHMLIAVTEMNTRSAIDRLVDGLSRATT